MRVGMNASTLQTLPKAANIPSFRKVPVWELFALKIYYGRKVNLRVNVKCECEV